ncbi:LacI family transcriptional regulator [Paenibacillus sp. JMULE4]|nr:LacI family transcriptional regulator [Paenibacillus sp. JMULE4]
MKDKYHDPYFSELIYGVERELLDQGYTLGFTYDAQDLNNMSVVDEIQANDYGIICIATTTELLELLSKKVQYIISVGGTPELDIDYVTVDFEKGARQSVDHLLRLGHKKIAYIGSSSFQNSVSLEKEQRFLGYKNALEEQGIALHKEWIADGQFTIGGGYEAMKQILMAKDRPTALFTASDQMALGAYRAIQEAGLTIPGDIAVTSFDDIEMSQFMHPPLTTVKVDKEELGRIAVKLFIQRIEGSLPLPMASYLPTRLIVRESCGFSSK